MELLRRLILSGFISLVGRGSVFQAVVACFVSFVFFAAAFQQRPYKQDHLNYIKLYADFVLFIVTLISVVLQSQEADFALERVGTEMYEDIALAVNFALVPLVIFLTWTVGRDVKDFAEEVQDLRKTTSSIDMEQDVEQVEKPKKAKKAKKVKAKKPKKQKPMAAEGKKVSNPLFGDDDDDDDNDNTDID